MSDLQACGVSLVASSVRYHGGVTREEILKLTDLTSCGG